MKECLRCGKCCRRIVFKFRVQTKNDLDFYRARGFRIKGFDVCAEIPHVCVRLDQETNLCTLHDGNKPFLCRIYPSYLNKRDLNEGCGFK